MAMDDQGEHMRVRVPPEVKAKWDAMLESRKITSQRAHVALMAVGG